MDVHLEAKQRLRYNYGLIEPQLLQYTCIARKHFLGSPRREHCGGAKEPNICGINSTYASLVSNCVYVLNLDEIAAS